MTTAMQVRVSLKPREMVRLDSTDNQTIRLNAGTTSRTRSSIATRRVASKRRTRKKG